MIARELRAWLESVSHLPQVVHVVGLRQTGKTTLFDEFRKSYPRSLHYPLFDLVTLRRYESSPERWVLEIEDALKRAEQLPLQVFVDEVQKIPALFQAIQGLYDQHKEDIKFWIWGSSARPQKRHRAETLAGRVVSNTLWPFSQSELLKNESVIPLLFDRSKLETASRRPEPRAYATTLARWFTHTLLPEPNLLDDDAAAAELLQSYQATYLENEIRRENLVQDIGTFDQFLQLAASEDSSIVNFSSKAKVLGVAPHTIKSYYSILNDTFVCTFLNAYSKSVRVQIAKSPKVYFADSGFARFVAGERICPPPGSSAYGRLIEGFVVNELIKYIANHRLPWRLSYLRTKTGIEADCIISDGTSLIAIEIKASSKIEKRDVSQLRKAMSLISDNVYGVIFSMDPKAGLIDKGIYNIPIWTL